MTTEVTIETPVVETVVETPVVETVVVTNPFEEQAREQGWVSKEEWVAGGRDAEDHRPAKEFVDRGELYKSIHSTRRELKQTQATLDALQRHHKYVFEKAHAQAVKDLKVEKRAAIRAEDFEAVEAIETEMEELTTEHQRASNAMAVETQRAAQAGPPPEFVEFVSRNQWYTYDKGMRDEADAIGLVYLNNGGDRTQLLSHVEKKIKQRFPEKFGVNRAAPNAVAPVNRTAAKGPKSGEDDLDDSEKEAMRTFVKAGVMTEAAYRAELKKVKERK